MIKGVKRMYRAIEHICRNRLYLLSFNYLNVLYRGRTQIITVKKKSRFRFRCGELLGIFFGKANISVFFSHAECIVEIFIVSFYFIRHNN